MRARAGALVLAVCDDERADGDTAEDGGVEQSPCTGGVVPSQTPRQHVGDECLRRLMRILSCAMDSSAAPSAALAAATERPSAVSAAIVEWGMVPQTPTLRLPRAGRRSTCVGRVHRGQGVLLRHTGSAEPRVALGVFASNSGTKAGVVSNSGLYGDDNAPVVVKTVQVRAERAASAVVVVANRRGGAATTIRVTTRVTAGRGERRQRSFPDPGSS